MRILFLQQSIISCYFLQDSQCKIWLLIVCECVRRKLPPETLIPTNAALGSLQSNLEQAHYVGDCTSLSALRAIEQEKGVYARHQQKNLPYVGFFRLVFAS